jgi:hypothetical protein
MKHSTTAPTKAEAERMTAIKELGICVACYQLGREYHQYVDIHHLLSGNKRRGHMFTVGLCIFHHRSIPLDDHSINQTTRILGPSLARGSKPFRAKFGTDDELLELQNRLLNE